MYFKAQLYSRVQTTWPEICFFPSHILVSSVLASVSGRPLLNDSRRHWISGLRSEPFNKQSRKRHSFPTKSPKWHSIGSAEHDFVPKQQRNHCDRHSWILGTRMKWLGVRNQALPKHKGEGGEGGTPEENIASCYQTENGFWRERKKEKIRQMLATFGHQQRIKKKSILKLVHTDILVPRSISAGGCPTSCHSPQAPG